MESHVLIKWLYRIPRLHWLLRRAIVFWAQHFVFLIWSPFLGPHQTTHHSNIGIRTRICDRITHIYLTYSCKTLRFEQSDFHMFPMSLDVDVPSHWLLFQSIPISSIVAKCARAFLAYSFPTLEQSECDLENWFCPKAQQLSKCSQQCNINQLLSNLQISETHKLRVNECSLIYDILTLSKPTRKQLNLHSMNSGEPEDWR